MFSPFNMLIGKNEKNTRDVDKFHRRIDALTIDARIIDALIIDALNIDALIIDALIIDTLNIEIIVQ